MKAPCSLTVIMVTHNCADYFDTCLRSLCRQTLLPQQIVVVDSGSTSKDYLHALGNLYPVEIIFADNIGFSRANNMGLAVSGLDDDFFLFANPDTVFPAECLEKACAVLQASPAAGCLTPRLLGYDMLKKLPTGRLDSTGIFRKPYGRWFDRGQGERDQGQFANAESVPAACGAFFFMRKKAVLDALLAPQVLFDPDFFLYKEDIELSLRLRKKGWEILYTPEVRVYHARGWQKDRRKMPWELRLEAARNEVLLYRKHPSPYLLWAECKRFMVSSFRL